MSDCEHESLSIEDDEIVWKNSSISLSDTDFIVLPRPLNAHSTLSDCTSEGGFSSTLDGLSLCDRDSFRNSFSTTAESDNDLPPSDDDLAERDVRSLSSSSASFEQYHSGTSTRIASYDDASAFISSFLSSPANGNDAQLNFLRALIVELGVRPPNDFDLPSTLTSARKLLKAEVHVNIKEYVTTRHKGQAALRGILKPSRRALRQDIRKGNKASLGWVKRCGLQVLLVTCYS